MATRARLTIFTLSMITIFGFASAGRPLNGAVKAASNDFNNPAGSGVQFPAVNLGLDWGQGLPFPFGGSVAVGVTPNGEVQINIGGTPTAGNASGSNQKPVGGCSFCSPPGGGMQKTVGTDQAMNPLPPPCSPDCGAPGSGMAKNMEDKHDYKNSKSENIKQPTSEPEDKKNRSSDSQEQPTSDPEDKKNRSSVSQDIEANVVPKPSYAYDTNIRSSDPVSEKNKVLASAPDPRKQLASAPDPRKQLASAPDPRKQLASAPDPRKQLASAPGPHKQLASAPDPRKQLASAPDPLKQLASAPDPRKELASEPDPDDGDGNNRSHQANISDKDSKNKYEKSAKSRLEKSAKSSLRADKGN